MEHLVLSTRRKGQRSAAEKAIDARVGHRIRTQRTLLKLTRPELALRVGVTGSQIERYERGERVAASRLVSLALALDVPVAWFFEEEPDDR